MVALLSGLLTFGFGIMLVVLVAYIVFALISLIFQIIGFFL